MSVEIKVTGLAELAKRLNVVPGLKNGIKAAMVYLKGKVDVYPPKSEANSPGRVDSKGRPMGYYERGQGSYSASGKLYKTSEVLGRSWTMSTKNNGYTGIVGTNVTYAPYVQDRDHQAWFHKLRGWKTAQDYVETEGAKVKAIIKAAILHYLKRVI